MMTPSVVLLHNKAPTRAPVKLEHINWELFDQLPYSPDLNPRDHHLFGYLKNWTESHRFNNSEKPKESVETWLS
jgi:hypothetical protein